MSAFIVSKTHLDAILSAGLYRPWRIHGNVRWFDGQPPGEDCFAEGEPWGPGSSRWFNEHVRYLTEETAGQVGAMLWAENRLSVNHRYAEEEWEDPYVFQRLMGSPNPVLILKAIDCFEYQSCEHPGWPSSEAYRFCEAMRRVLIPNIRGYDKVPGWEIHSRDVFLEVDHIPDL